MRRYPVFLDQVARPQVHCLPFGTDLAAVQHWRLLMGTSIPIDKGYQSLFHLDQNSLLWEKWPFYVGEAGKFVSAQPLGEGISEKDSIQLSELINTKDPREVLNEVKALVFEASQKFSFKPIDKAFEAIIRLFSGRYPGYQACNTGYHDLNHTMDTFLAMARLIHGAYVTGISLDSRNATLGLISSLMHDTGYIQHIHDRSGSGAKYTFTHVERSIDFMEEYFCKTGYSREDFHKCRNGILCTGLNIKTTDIGFESKENELISKMLGTADLLGQMADRTYLEKLLILFTEFKEANVRDFENEFDLLRKTLEFYQATKKRLANELGGVNNFMRAHFVTRWGAEEDLYHVAIEKNIKYLRLIIEDHGTEYHEYLRRGPLVQKRARNNTLTVQTQVPSPCPPLPEKTIPSDQPNP